MAAFYRKTRNKGQSRKKALEDWEITGQFSSAFVRTGQSRKAIRILEEKLEGILGRKNYRILESEFSSSRDFYESKDLINEVMEDLSSRNLNDSYQETIALFFENLGLAYLYNSGRNNSPDVRKSILYLNTAIDIYEKIYGSNHTKLAMLMLSISRGFSLLGDSEQQWRFIEKAFRMKAYLHGLHTDGIRRSANNRRWCKSNKNVVDPDAYFLEQAVSLFSKAFTSVDDHHEVARLFQEMYRSPRYANEALLLKQSLAIYQNLYGDSSPAVAEVKRDLGMLFIRRGDIEEAEPFLKDALKIYSLIYPERHPKLTSIQHLLYHHFSYESDRVSEESVFRGLLKQLENTLYIRSPRYIKKEKSLLGCFLS